MFGHKNEYDKLNQMLDSAISGKFTEEIFDESELSKLQTKLMRYLMESSMSEKKLDEERAKLQELITNISHQTKTPLTNIKLYSDLLLEQVHDESQAEYIKEISNHTAKLEQLIAVLVKMSRLETGIFQYKKENHNLCDLLKIIEQSYKGVAKQKEISLELILNESHAAYFDEKWTLEALGNIVDNAIKYSGEHTAITLSSFQYEMFSGIRISDEGPGIKEEEIPIIFGRFERGREVSQQDGIGVGLYLAREIIEGQGGYIKVSSKLGEGSTFDVFLPRE